MVAPETFAVFAGVSVLTFLAGYGYRGWKAMDPPAGPVESYLDDRREELRSEYASGHISRERFAAEIETVEDPTTERIMHLARDVDGVGPHIAFKVAREFDGVDDLATADRADLAAINRVGENRANGIRSRARQEVGIDDGRGSADAADGGDGGAGLEGVESVDGDRGVDGERS